MRDTTKAGIWEKKDRLSKSNKVIEIKVETDQALKDTMEESTTKNACQEKWGSQKDQSVNLSSHI